MRSEAKDVTQYLQEVPAERREALTLLRRLCLEVLDGYEEGMDYGMPSYSEGGQVKVAFASQKQYISFYIMKEEVMDQFRPRLRGLSLGKGCIRYSGPEKIDFDLVRELLNASFHADVPVC